VVSPGIAQAIRNLPSLAQQLKMLDAGKIVEQVKMAPLIAAQAKAAHALFDSFSRRQRERAERAERELAEKAKADKARRRNGGKKAGKKLQRNAGQGQQAHR
jgi:hypothetical protein